MKADEIKRLYDRAYAATYDEKFLDSVITSADTRYEVELIRSLLTPGAPWLDVACGTGYFLRQFPDVSRVGLDLSPGMIEHAKTQNPDVEFVQHDFRNPHPEWDARFGLVSCMWYAYCYVDTVDEIVQTIENLATWTAQEGRCYVPLCDPNLITRQNIPYHQDTGHAGEMSITGILWSYVEEDGAKAHKHLLSPHLEFMKEQFRRYFDTVEIVHYPEVSPTIGRRPALIASGKKTRAASVPRNP